MSFISKSELKKLQNFQINVHEYQKLVMKSYCGFIILN